MAAKTAGAVAFQGLAETWRGDLAGKGIDRHEELSPSRLPVLAIRSDPTAGNQQVDMGVIAQLAVPGVEHGQHAGQCPEVPFLGTEILDRRGRDLHQHAVQQLLVATEHRTTARARSRRRENRRTATVRLTLFEPLPGLGSVAFGACPVPAAVVVPERVVAVVAAVEATPSSGVQQAAMSESAFFCEGIIRWPY